MSEPTGKLGVLELLSSDSRIGKYLSRETIAVVTAAYGMLETAAPSWLWTVFGVATTLIFRGAKALETIQGSKSKVAKLEAAVREVGTLAVEAQGEVSKLQLLLKKTQNVQTGGVSINDTQDQPTAGPSF